MYNPVVLDVENSETGKHELGRNLVCIFQAMPRAQLSRKEYQRKDNKLSF